MLGQFVDYMDDKIILFLGVDHSDHIASRVCEGALVAHLSAALAIERSAVEHQLEELLVFDLDVAIAGNMHFALHGVISHKLLLCTG